MSTSVYCTATLTQADQIIDELKEAGFSTNDISVLLADKGGTRDFAIENHSKAPEGAAAGAGAGAALGGVAGWLAGIGTLVIPGVGPLIAAGPIMAALSGAAVGGTLGGLAGGLVGIGIPEFEARRFEGKVKTGSALVSVHAESGDEVGWAKEIFERGGGQDISTSAETSAANSR